MNCYALGYRLRFTPWERYGPAAAQSIATLLDREEAERSRPLGRALDLGCGRGQYAPELANRGWEVVGVDYVPQAIAEANRRGIPGARFLVGDVTDLPPDLGRFDFFLDVGCFQGLNADERAGEARSIAALANPGATLLLMAFGPSRMASMVGGVSRDDVEEAFRGWEMVSVEPAETSGLGWPMSKTAPPWYRLRRP